MNHQELLNHWSKHAHSLKSKHYNASNDSKRFHSFTGLPLVILAAISSASIWVVMVNTGIILEDSQKIILAIINTMISVLSAVQVFLNFEKRSLEFRKAAAKYGAIAADIESLILENPGEEVMSKEMERIKKDWKEITEIAPTLPNKYSKIELVEDN